MYLNMYHVSRSLSIILPPGYNSPMNKTKALSTREVLTHQVAEILPSRAALQRLMRKRKIRLYLGIDPTGSQLHLGHAKALWKLQQFAELGHEVILVVGDGTVLAGDPSQRDKARPRITQKEIAQNMKTWRAQAEKILDFSKVRMRHNGDWLKKLKLVDIIEIASHISAVQLFRRDMFQRRIQHGDTVWAHETLYPLLQGYDSVALDVDLEIGGTDQVFNMLIGRELQRKMRQREKFVLTLPMIPGLDGKQMSKTSGNTVNLDENPQEMYGKLMSLRDDLIIPYFGYCTRIPPAKIRKMEKELKQEKIGPRDLKARLAREVVTLYYGERKAEKAEQDFERVFREKKTPTSMPKVQLKKKSMELVELLKEIGFAPSKSEAKRLVTQGGVRIDGKVQGDPQKKIQARKGMVVRAGKRRFIKIA